MPASSAAVRRAQQATAVDLAVSVPPTCVICDRSFSFSVKTTTDVGDGEQAQIWHMFEENTYELCRASSFGWNPRKKKAEMFNSLSRFVIVRDTADPTHALAGSDIVAYSIFRFEREERQDVVYCYELQVSKASRRFGLGRVLVQILSGIGAQWGMTKIMLTAFKANHAALLFYESTGFIMDETSPDFDDDPEGEMEAECDYLILSRRIPY